MTDSILEGLIKRKSNADKLIREQLLEIEDGLATFPVINGGSSYGLSNFLLKLMLGAGLLMIFIGVIGLVIALIGMEIPFIGGSLALLLAGIITAVSSQLTLAITETADNVRTIASVLQQHLYTENIIKNETEDEAPSEDSEKIYT